MEGLEISEVLLSEVAHGNDVLRCDAEYFGKVALSTINRLQSIKSISLNHMAFITDGIHTSLPFIADGDIKVLSAKHPKDNFIDLSQFETISAVYHDLNPRTALRENDVLISTVGTIGNAAVVTSDILPANSDRHIGIIRLRSNGPTPFYLSTFLVSRYGRLQSVRETTGNVQPNLFISKIGKLLIPRFSNNFENTITAQIQRAYKKRKQAIEFLWQAEQTLLNALGLENWQAPEPLSYVRGSRDVFSAGRLDAEYYHPAKFQALEKLENHSDMTVGDFFVSVQELWQPEDGSPHELVRNYDLTDALNPYLDSGKEPVERGTIASTKKVIKPGDLVVSRLRSYLKEIAIVRHKEKLPMVASTEFIVLRGISDKKLPVEPLMIYLRSLLPQLVFKWSQDGSNHPRFNEKELLRLPVPRILFTQSEIYVKAVQQMISDREKAAQLLDAAKRAVEIAIEENEDAAMTYLSDAMQKADEKPKENRI